MEDHITYDILGRIIGSERTGTSSEFTRNIAYTYDALGRLLSYKEGQNTESYTYDAFGNRTVKRNGIEKATYQYDAMNKLVSMNANGILYKYSYDKRGNLTEERKNGSLVRNYTYDATNHMVFGSNLETDERSEYGYNGLYMRVKNAQTLMEDGSPYSKKCDYVVDYLSKVNNDLVKYEENLGATQVIYGHGYERLCQKIISEPTMPENIRKVYFQSDFMGSPNFVTNGTNGMLYYVEHEVWGDLNVPSGEALSSVFDDSLCFTNYSYDKAIGKYFAQARFYDSEVGRMHAKDPVKRGMNPYLYCDNDPVNKTDPTGQVPHIIVAIALGGVIGGVGGFLESAVTQALNGEDFDIKKALGSAANSAVVSSARAAMISTGVGIGTMLVSEFVSGSVGNALEQKIVKNRVDIGESITSGVINAASGAVFGNRPLRSVRDAFWRGGKAGATTAAINNLSNALRGNRTGNVPNRSTNGWQSAVIGRDPKTLCGSQSPFEGAFGYRSEYQNGNGEQNRNGFDLGSFVKDTAVGFVMGGLTSVTFYGAGKAVDALQNSVRSVHKSGKKKDTLYHYTNEKGMNGIVDSKQLNPSLKANNPKDARYGDGQYLSDIKPDTQTPVSLSKKFINVPNKYKYTHYVEIDVTDLNVIQGRDGVLVIPNESPLDLTNRLVGTGVVGK